MRKLSFRIYLLLLFPMLCSLSAQAQEPYPYPVKYINLTIEQQSVKMAYMDVPPLGKYSSTVMLFHGKNFNGYYWKDVAVFLAARGCRVIIPDQVGWGRSDKPNIHYSFHQLATNNKALLDTLNVAKLVIIGHSTGGMLAERFALMYPDMVEMLVLEDPVGLEDYRSFVSYTPTDKLYETELAATYDSYKKYMLGYFPQWNPDHDELVKQQAAALTDPNFKQIARANALTYQMIYEQPTCYELKNISTNTLLVIGSEDRTIVGKDKLSEEAKKAHGQYPQLAKAAKAQMKHCQLIEMPGVGHIPHIQLPEAFTKALATFLNLR